MTTTYGDPAIKRAYPGGANNSTYEVCTSFPVQQPGTVTQFMAYSGGMGSNAPRMQYCIFRPTGGSSYTVIGCTNVVQFPNQGLNILPVYIPVITGDCFGYYKLDSSSDISFDQGTSTWWTATGSGSATSNGTNVSFSFSYHDIVSLQIQVTSATTKRCLIQSNYYPNCYVRMDASSVTVSTDNGSGTVNVQYYSTGVTAGPNEQFDLVPMNGNTMIRSVLNPHAFLRMNGAGVTQPASSGAGVVNCQYASTGGYELFSLVANADGTTGIQSIAFPGVFLRLDGSTISSSQNYGGGVVNCQFGAGPYESFIFKFI